MTVSFYKITLTACQSLRVLFKLRRIKFSSKGVLSVFYLIFSMLRQGHCWMTEKEKEIHVKHRKWIIMQHHIQVLEARRLQEHLL